MTQGMAIDPNCVTMASNLRASTMVWVLIAPHPPIPVAMRDLAAGLDSGVYPAQAGVSPNSSEPWFAAGDVVAVYKQFGVTRSVPVVVIALGIPILLVGLHAVIFGLQGSYAFIPLGLVGVVVALAVTQSDALRIRSIGMLLPRWAIVSAAILVLGTEIAAVASALTLDAHEKRVNGIMAQSAPCAVRDLSPADIAWIRENDDWRRDNGTLESRNSAYAALQQQCDHLQAKRRREEGCAKAASAVESRQAPVSEGGAVKTDELELLGRIASQKLTAVDLANFGPIPCSDTGSKQRIRTAFIAAARQVGDDWLIAGIPVELKTAVKSAGLAPEAAESLRGKVESDAAAALKLGTDVESLNQSFEECELANGVTGTSGPKCKLVRDRHSAILARDAAVAKAKEARCSALKKAREQCTSRCEGRLAQDELGFADFDKGMDCGERCERAVPTTGCD